jgi:hypothetical protein
LKSGWWNAPVSAPLRIWWKPHRLSFRLNDEYLSEVSGEKYRGKTWSQKWSGRRMTKELPLGSQQMISSSIGSIKMAWSRLGNVGFVVIAHSQFWAANTNQAILSVCKNLYSVYCK